jgi:ribosome-associated protein
MSRRDEGKTARQIARSKTKRAGDRSSRLAHQLMKLLDPALDRLALEDDLRACVDRARAITAQNARRRAERTLAGDLRRFDLDELDDKVSKLHESANADASYFRLAEHWRAKLIEEGMAAAAEFPGAVDDELPRLVDAAQRERSTGKPPGAAKKLFRHVVALLTSNARSEET